MSHAAENDGLPCWRGCPLDVASGLRRHQWPCEFSGAVDRRIPPVDPDDLCLTCGATNGVCRCHIPPAEKGEAGA